MPRMSVNVNDETADAIMSLSLQQGCSVTEVVHKAIGAYVTFRDAAERGDAIEVISHDGTTVQVMIP